MMDKDMLIWCLIAGAIPLLVKAVWHLNDTIFTAYLRVTSNIKQGSMKLPPGHMGLPLIGETLTFLWYFKFLRRPDDFINSKKLRYGEGKGIYRSHIFGYPTIITCSPTINKFVLRSVDDFSARWPSADLVGHNCIINVEGKQHVRLRSFIVNAINHPKSLQKIALMVQPRIVSTLRSWAMKGTINASFETKKVTFENICQMFASKGPGPLLDEIKQCFEGLVAGLRSYPLDFPGTTFRRALKCRRRLDAVFREELEKRKGRGNTTDYHEGSGDLMDGLMGIKDEDGGQLSNDEVVDNIVAFIIAGFESTAASLMWALYHLSKSPHALQKLREENAGIKKEKKEDFITTDVIAKLKYTAKVVEETIRMANVALSVFRAANKDVEYEGYIIPKGWQVVVWLRSLHTDPKNFDDPLSFKPERWDNPPKPGTFQVFGGGPRICAGNMLVRIQLTIMIHHLTLGYKWELLNPDAKINYLPHPRPSDGAVISFTKIDEAI